MIFSLPYITVLSTEKWYTTRFYNTKEYVINEYMIYFTSDLHFGHTNIIKYCKRPFKDSNEMDKVLITNWNSFVRKEDEVYILGDFTMNSLNKVKEYLDQLNGRKYLIRGNHDNYAKNKDHIDGIEWIKDYYELNYNKQIFILFHYPIAEWNHFYHGSIHLHGHAHNHLEYNLKQKELGRKIYDVGVDANDYRPVSIYEILDWMKD